ncbi:hypothetical protein JKP88DRAFT_349554 [Tribonema minus]|uniref:HSF-type DNA-binding domain-containing protein n=1 Tax=Tribonema minus TaxID=303371 RepID=A0A836CCE8_9STRA|nr:hypothetical protein JKP88DRAFT_349554 [Tribonema minus]
MAPRGSSQHGETRGYADANDAHNGGSSSSSSSSCASSNGRTVSSREADTANGRSSTTSSSGSVGGGGRRQMYDSSSSTSYGLPAAKPQATGRDLEGAKLLQHMQQHSEDDDDDMEHHEGGGEHSMNAEARAGGADTGKMLEECPSVVRWERGSLYVMDPVALQETVLPRFFRTARYESFLRQLHMYNFRKVEGKGRWNPAVYSHPSLRGTSDMSAIMDLRPRIRMAKVGGVKTKQASSAAANGGGGAAASGAASSGSGGEGGRSSTLSSGGGGSSARFAAQAPAAGAGMPEGYAANMQGAEGPGARSFVPIAAADAEAVVGVRGAHMKQVAGAASMAPGMIPFQQGMFAGGMYPQHSPFVQFAGGYGTLGEPTTQLQVQMLSAYGGGYPYLRQLGMPSEPTTTVFSPTGAAAPAFAAAHAGYAGGLYTQPFLAYSAGFAPAVQGSTHMPVMQAAPQYATVSYVDPSQQVAARHAAPQPVHPAFALVPAAASSDGSGSEQGTTSRSSAALESDASRHRDGARRSRHRDGARRRGGGSDAVKQESTRGSSSSSSKQQHSPQSATSPASGGAHEKGAAQRQLYGQQQGAPHKQQRQRRSSKVAQPSALAAGTAAAAAGPNERSGSSSSNGSGSSATTASGDGSGRRSNGMASGSGGSSATGPFADSALAVAAAGRMPPMMLPRAAFAEAALHPAALPLQALPPAMLAAAAGQGVPLHYAHQHLWGGGGVPQPAAPINPRLYIPPPRGGRREPSGEASAGRICVSRKSGDSACACAWETGARAGACRRALRSLRRLRPPPLRAPRHPRPCANGPAAHSLRRPENNTIPVEMHFEGATRVCSLYLLSFGTSGGQSQQQRFHSMCQWYIALLGRLFGDFDRSSPPPNVAGWMWYDGITNLNYQPQSQRQHGGGRGAQQPAEDMRVRGMTRAGACLWRMLSPSPGMPSGGPSGAGDAGGMSDEIPSFFQIIRNRHAVHFVFPVARLPLPSRLLLSNSPDTERLACSNVRLYKACLEDPPAAVKQHKIRLSMLELYWFKFAEYAASVKLDSTGGYVHAGPADGGLRYRDIQGKMLRAWGQFGARGLLHGNPYNTLVLGRRSAEFPALRLSYRVPSADYAREYLPHGNGASSAAVVVGASELFLRAVFDFWLGQNAVLRHDAAPASAQRWPRAPGANGMAGVSRARAMAQAPFDPIDAKTPDTCPFAPLSDAALHALLLLCAHLLADPALEAIERAIGQAIGAEVESAAAALDGREMGANALRGPRSLGLCAAAAPGAQLLPPMTPALQLLQPYVLDFLRLAFTRSSMHANSTAFALCVELWLLWLQPWTAPAILRGAAPARASGSPYATQGRGGPHRALSRVASAGSMLVAHMVAGARRRRGARAALWLFPPWRAWVLSNAYLYTVPLASIVRHARDMPLIAPQRSRGGAGGSGYSPTGSGEEEKGNMNMMLRIVGAFPDAVVDTLRCAEAIIAADRGGDRRGASARAAATNGGAAPSEMECQLALAHARAVERSVGTRPFSIAQHKASRTIKAEAEAQALLEEVAVQTVRAQGGAARHSVVSDILNRFMPGGGGDKEPAESKLATELRRIFAIDKDWKPQQALQYTEDSGAGTMLAPEREQSDWGYWLSKEGRQQVLQGERMCRPCDVVYLGDPMLAPTRSSEVAWLKFLLVKASLWLNEVQLPSQPEIAWLKFLLVKASLWLNEVASPPRACRLPTAEYGAEDEEPPPGEGPEENAGDDDDDVDLDASLLDEEPIPPAVGYSSGDAALADAYADALLLGGGGSKLAVAEARRRAFVLARARRRESWRHAWDRGDARGAVRALLAPRWSQFRVNLRPLADLRIITVLAAAVVLAKWVLPRSVSALALVMYVSPPASDARVLTLVLLTAWLMRLLLPTAVSLTAMSACIVAGLLRAAFV